MMLSLLYHIVKLILVRLNAGIIIIIMSLNLIEAIKNAIDKEHKKYWVDCMYKFSTIELPKIYKAFDDKD
jgi:hypothetical protein